MSSQPSFDTTPSRPSSGEIQHTHFLSEHIGALYLNDEYSDVTLIVEKQPFSAHKVILAARSDYFRALLFGGMKESSEDEIELKDTPLAAFKQLLRYIYTGQLTLSNQSDELVLEVLGLAHQYGFQDLQTSVSDYLRAMLSVRNVCLIYDTASLYALPDLISACRTFMDKHATEILAQESFMSLSSSAIREIISRDSFCAPEVDIFRAVERWVVANPITDEEVQAILSSVRLSLMSTQDLLKVVRPTGLVLPDVLLDAIESKTESRDTELRYRGYLIVDSNVATPKHGATVVVGEVKQALLDGDTKNYDMERGFSRHPIDDASKENGIVIKLGMQCIINHMRLLLWDKDQRSYSYYIEVSMDQKDWVKVVDHTKYLCRSWQDLYFPARVVRFIRVVGTHNTVNKVFHAVALEAYYTKKQFSLDSHGIVIPRHNVATIPSSAIVIEGVCRSRNALLNGDTSNYDWDSGYTCHQLGSGAIVVQLAQPYAISSMRLLLWDCDKRTYSYYIEVSLNKEDWEVVFDRTKVACRSWQLITFPRRPVVFIRIVGTHNTANEVFHCVHLECPAISHVAADDEKERPASPSTSTVSSNSGIDESVDADLNRNAAVVEMMAENNYEADGAAAAATLPNDQESGNPASSTGSNQTPILGAAALPTIPVSSGHGRSNQAGLPMGASANSLANQNRRSSASSFEQFVMRLNYRSHNNNNGSNSGDESGNNSTGAVPRTGTSSRRRSYNSTTSSLDPQ